MNTDSIVLPLSSRSTSNETSIWFHTHIEPDCKSITLHSTCNSMYMGNAFRFLTEPLLSPAYINNNTLTYIASAPASFFVFTTTRPSDDTQRCDNHYGYWKNNGTTVKVQSGIKIKRTYWYDSQNPKFRKQEFHVQSAVAGSAYCGLMVYYKPSDVNIVADAALVSPHRNSKKSVKAYKRHSNEQHKRTKINVASLNNPNAQFDYLADKFDHNPARNPKQISNMQYAYHNPANMLDHQLRLANI